MLRVKGGGIDFVYDALDRLRAGTGATDLIAILEDRSLGRQAFRSGGRPLDSPWSRDVALSGAEGIHATPTAVDEPTATAVLDLFAVALNLEAALHDSRHDHLTGLLNRRSFDELLAGSCARSTRYRWPVGLILIDLDRFKTVNDRLGHPTGDEVLRAVGDELRLHLRAGDAAARLGGDEFAVLLPNLVRRHSVELVARVEQAIRRAVPEAEISVSSGVALAPEDGVTPAALYERADDQLYDDKRARR